MNLDLLNKQISAYQMGSISVKTVLLLLIIGGFMFGFIYILKKYIIPYLGSRKAVKKAKNTIYRIEILAWGAFAIFGIYQLLTDSLYITIVILVIIILAGINYWRDLFAGIVFRIENKFEVNDPVRFDDYNGILFKINPRNIQIKTDEEELVLVPFRNLSKNVFIKRQAKGKLHSAKINLPITGKSEEEIAKSIQKWLFHCPWAIINDKTVVHETNETSITITVYAVDIESISKIEEYLISKTKG
jgi:small-conductance mechanosensitive channel